jgi:transposase-like protein
MRDMQGSNEQRPRCPECNRVIPRKRLKNGKVRNKPVKYDRDECARRVARRAYNERRKRKVGSAA